MDDDTGILRSQQGQALAEFAIVAGLAILVMCGAAKWGVSQWRKVSCLHAVFESAHASLLQASLGEGTVTAERECGRSHERISLRTLESFRVGEL